MLIGFLVELSKKFLNASNEIKDESKCSADDKKVKEEDVPFTDALSEDWAVMVVLFAALVAERAMFGAEVSINAACDAMNSLLWEGLLLIFEDGSGVEKKKNGVEKGYRVEKRQDDSSEVLGDLRVVK